MGDLNINRFVNFCLKYLSEIDIPIKRGTFIEFRNGMINISPIGRNCSQEERDDLEKYDKVNNCNLWDNKTLIQINKIREKFISTLKEAFSDLNLHYAIGGQISFDVIPKGWDKSFCLKYINDYENVYFFGDKTNEV